MRKILIVSGKIILYFIIFTIIYFISEFVLSSIAVNKNPENPKQIPVYILTNGVHTDIVVPAKNEIADWTKEIKFSNTKLSDSAGYRYIAFGWGDKGFYLETPTWADLKASVALKAALGLSSTAIHATYYKKMSQDADCKQVMISKAQYENLVSYIKKDFQTDENGNFINIKTDANYGNSDSFYEAKGRYFIFYTCNTWANNALKACGQRACLWTAFDKGIFEKYK